MIGLRIPALAIAEAEHGLHQRNHERIGSGDILVSDAKFSERFAVLVRALANNLHSLWQDIPEVLGEFDAVSPGWARPRPDGLRERSVLLGKGLVPEPGVGPNCPRQMDLVQTIADSTKLVCLWRELELGSRHRDDSSLTEIGRQAKRSRATDRKQEATGAERFPKIAEEAPTVRKVLAHDSDSWLRNPSTPCNNTRAR